MLRMHCTISLNDPDKYRVCELSLPLPPDDLMELLEDMGMAEEAAAQRYVVSFEYMSPELDALFLRIPRGAGIMQINQLTNAIQEMEDGARREYVKTILDRCPISMDEMLYHADRANGRLSGHEQVNMPRRNQAASTDRPQRERLHAGLMDKVQRDFYEIFDDWYDRMGLAEGGVLLADCSRIMKELRTAPPSDDAMRYLMRYEQPLRLILSYWEGEMGSYCREDFTQAIDKLMESGMEDHFAMDAAYEAHTASGGAPAAEGVGDNRLEQDAGAEPEQGQTASGPRMHQSM